MKILMMASVFFSLVSLANEPTVPPEPVGGACEIVENACEAAGKSQDCVSPILEGKAVEGVTVADRDIASCKHHKKHKSHKKHKRHHGKHHGK